MKISEIFTQEANIPSSWNYQRLDPSIESAIQAFKNIKWPKSPNNPKAIVVPSNSEGTSSREYQQKSTNELKQMIVDFVMNLRFGKVKGGFWIGRAGKAWIDDSAAELAKTLASKTDLGNKDIEALAKKQGMPTPAEQAAQAIASIPKDIRVKLIDFDTPYSELKDIIGDQGLSKEDLKSSKFPDGKSWF